VVSSFGSITISVCDILCVCQASSVAAWPGMSVCVKVDLLVSKLLLVNMKSIQLHTTVHHEGTLRKPLFSKVDRCLLFIKSNARNRAKR
jgi:hypothetical protein